MAFSRAFLLMFVIGFVAIQAQVAPPADVALRHLRAQNKKFFGSRLGSSNNNEQKPTPVPLTARPIPLTVVNDSE